MSTSSVSFQSQRHLESLSPKQRAPRYETLEVWWTLATVDCAGSGDCHSWSAPANWSGNIIPGVNDDMTISEARTSTINISGGDYNARSLNDTAPQSIELGASLSLEALPASSDFRQCTAIQSEGALNVGAGANLLIGPELYERTEILTHDDALSFTGGDTVTVDAAGFGPNVQILVGTCSPLEGSSAISNTAGNYKTQSVNSGGHLTASDSTFSVTYLLLKAGKHPQRRPEDKRDSCPWSNFNRKPQSGCLRRHGSRTPFPSS